METTSKKHVTVTLKRIESALYSIESSDTLSDGDHLWWVEANVVFEIRNTSINNNVHVSDINGHDCFDIVLGPKLIAIADPDPLASEILNVKLEVL